MCWHELVVHFSCLFYGLWLTPMSCWHGKRQEGQTGVAGGMFQLRLPHAARRKCFSVGPKECTMYRAHVHLSTVYIITGNTALFNLTCFHAVYIDLHQLKKTCVKTPAASQNHGQINLLQSHYTR